MNGWRLTRRVDNEEFPVRGRYCGALRPKELDSLEPMAKGLSESLVPGIGRGTQLALQALGTEEGYSSGACFHGPTFPDDPDVEVEQPRRVGQAGYNLPLHWNRVLMDLLIEAVAECNYVIGLLRSWGVLRLRLVEPEFHAIKKMKPGDVEALDGGPIFIGAEEDAGRKDAFETLDEAAVMNSILWELQELKQLRGSLKVNGTALLLDGQRRDPNRNQSILAKGQTKTWMGDDFQKEFAVLTTMNQLTGRGAAQGEAAEHEWASMECQLLLSIRTLFSDELD
jgi:hypothetical protein